MIKIYLARHGQDEDNRDKILNGRRDKPLTDQGEQQAVRLAEKISFLDTKIRKIYTSPLQRSIKTAEIVAEVLGVGEPEVLEDLIERDFGIMSGKKWDEIEKLCSPNILETENVVYFLSPDGGETFPQTLERARQTLDHLRKLHNKGSYLLVAHGDIGKMIFAAYYGLEWKDALESFNFGNSDLVLLSEEISLKDAHVFSNEQSIL